MRILVVDNYDSFVFNLVQYLGQLGVEAHVWRNDDARLSDADAIAARVRRRPAQPRPGNSGACGRVDRPGARLRRGAHPAAGRMPRPPGHRGRIRRHRGPCARTAARQDQQRISHQCRCAARTSGSVYRDPVSLADHPARDAARRAGGHRPYPQRCDHGRAARRSCRSTASSSTPSRSSPKAVTGCWPTGWPTADRRATTRWCAGWRTSVDSRPVARRSSRLTPAATDRTSA